MVVSMTAAQTQLVISHHAWDPGFFDGSDNPNIEDWISLYEWVSLHNSWDAMIMLANIIFYLKDTPRVWFKTHEAEITSWGLCKSLLGNRPVATC